MPMDIILPEHLGPRFKQRYFRPQKKKRSRYHLKDEEIQSSHHWSRRPEATVAMIERAMNKASL